MKRTYAGMMVLVAALAAGCSTGPVPKSETAVRNLHDEAQATISQLRTTDPSVQRFFDGAYAWAVFPAVKEGALGVGGAYGRGEVYRSGNVIGYAEMTQGSIGPQAGAEQYSEVIFFQNAGTFDQFTNGEFAFDARATAIAASKGAGVAADYQQGVLVFAMPQSGLMAQAAIGGQKFNYRPANGSGPQ